MRLILEFCLPLSISFAHNLKHVSFTQTFDYISLVVGGIFVTLMITIPTYFAVILCKNRNTLNDPHTIDIYGVHYENLKTNSMVSVLTYQLFLLRRLSMVVVLFLLDFSL